MAQAPTVELPKRLPLVITPDNRDSSTAKDAKLVNCYSEKSPDGDYWIYKRPGLGRIEQPSGGAAAGRGVYNWQGNLYSIFGNTVYKDGVAVSGTVDTTGGVYAFDSCLGATPKLQMGNGVKAYNYDSGAGLVQITDADFPSSFVKGWAYLDGTTYVGTAAGHLQGDDLNDPTSWNILNDITAYIEPDPGVAVAKQLTYVVFFKGWSTEIFYDAANETGSPLRPVPSAKINMGCATSGSVAAIDGMLFWVGVNKSKSVQIMQMDGLKAMSVSTDPIQRLLNAADFTTTYAYGVKNGSHRFYVLTVVQENITLVYDIDEKMWCQWTDVNGNYFPYVAGSYNSTYGQILQHESDGYLYSLDDAVYLDHTDPIVVDIVTPNFDGQTNRGKQLNVMKFVGDQVAGSTLQVRKNDQDYGPTKWSNFRMVDLSQIQPMLDNNGTFVRRAYHFRHKSPTFFRLKAIELQIDLCVL